jgi:DNA repair protein RadC
MATCSKKDRPLDRLLDRGPAGLSDSELLALVIGGDRRGETAVEAARRILYQVGGLERLLEQNTRSLCGLKGLGHTRAARLVASFELVMRAVEQRAKQRVRGRFVCSQDIFEAYRDRLGWLRQEIFMVVGLNNRNEIIREEMVAKGTLNECFVEPREVFRPLITEAAARAVLVHNHPSGDPSPSPNDVALTRRLSKAGELVGVPILDHVIITCSSHASLRDLGLMDSEPRAVAGR